MRGWTLNLPFAVHMHCVVYRRPEASVANKASPRHSSPLALALVAVAAVGLAPRKKKHTHTS